MGVTAPASARVSGWRWLPLAAAIAIADQLSKAWIEAHFSLYETFTVIPVLEITRLHNVGAAFSLLADQSGWQRWFFTALAIVVSVVLVAWLRRLDGRAQGWLAAALALILGGAIGNATDRLRLGYVIDFVHAHWGGAYFPAFNVADSAITIGAALLLLDAWRDSRRRGAR
ncbi:MAG: signal peptidase II [Steroidobacteraceae bacterium]